MTVTPEEIMIKVANEHSYETWAELMYDSHDFYQIECTKEAMLLYTEEVLKNLEKTKK